LTGTCCRATPITRSAWASSFCGKGRQMQRVLDQGHCPLAVSDTRGNGFSTGFAFVPAGTSAT